MTTPQADRSSPLFPAQADRTKLVWMALERALMKPVMKEKRELSVMTPWTQFGAWRAHPSPQTACAQNLDSDVSSATAASIHR